MEEGGKRVCTHDQKVSYTRLKFVYVCLMKDIQNTNAKDFKLTNLLEC